MSRELVECSGCNTLVDTEHESIIHGLCDQCRYNDASPEYPTPEIECQRCGYCCSHAWVPLGYDITAESWPATKDWLKARGEYIQVAGKYVWLRLEYDCDHLKKTYVKGVHRKGYECDIYDTRPNVCRQAVCPLSLI